MIDLVSRDLSERLEALGQRGETWLAEAPDILRRLAGKWRVEPGYLVDSESSVVAIRGLRRGRPVVIKLARPGPHLDREIAILQAARGRGYVHLYDADPERGGLLLESLGASIRQQAGHRPDLDPHSIRERVAATLHQAWQVPRDLAPPVDERTHQAAVLLDEIDEGARTLAVEEFRPAINRALAYAVQRLEARDPLRQVLVHGDANATNILAVAADRPGAESGYVFVGPEGFRCEPEYDLAGYIRDANRSIMASEDAVVTLRNWCAHLAGLTETDAEAVWQWSYIGRVTMGLRKLTTSPLHGRLYLQTATWLITRRPD